MHKSQPVFNDMPDIHPKLLTDRFLTLIITSTEFPVARHHLHLCEVEASCTKNRVKFIETVTYDIWFLLLTIRINCYNLYEFSYLSYLPALFQIP
jgi:hypothetical protein